MVGRSQPLLDVGSDDIDDVLDGSFESNVILVDDDPVAVLLYALSISGNLSRP